MRGFALRPVAIVVLLKTALELAFADRYGWHRDTLYYAVAGRHLQGGYVEFPPVTALISALAHALYGWSLLGFRSFPVLAGAGTVIVAALVARDLGANRRAQTFAAIGVAFAPGVLATNDLFQPVAFDQLTTMLVLWLALRLALGRGSWVWLGIAAGVGLETKYTIAVVLVLLIATFAVWRRDVLRSWGFPLAIAIAALLTVPNLDLGGRARLDQRALVPASAAERERRDACAVHRECDPADAARLPGCRRGSRVARAQPCRAPARLDDRRDGRRVLRARRQVVLRAPGDPVRRRRRRDSVRALGDDAAAVDRRRRVCRRGPARLADRAAGPAAEDRRECRRDRGARRLRRRDRLAWARADRRAACGRRRRDRGPELRRSRRAGALRPRPAAGRVGSRHVPLLAARRDGTARFARRLLAQRRGDILRRLSRRREDRDAGRQRRTRRAGRALHARRLARGRLAAKILSRYET